MKAVQFIDSMPRYLLSKVIGALHPPVFWSSLSCLQYREVSLPSLPNENWVRVKIRYGGICGSDLNLIRLHDSPALSPFVSLPFTIGHENVGTIAELGSGVEGFTLGDRVVVEPSLGCVARGFTELCPACQRGENNLCYRFTEGHIAPGLLIGDCRDTGGSWSPYLVAHKSQLLRVSSFVSDENAVMVEPFATALHAVLRSYPLDEETVLVLGTGVIGLCIIAALRALGSRARVIVLAKYPFQGEMARRYGADQEIRFNSPDDYYREVAQATGGVLHKPLLGKRVMVGGADLVFDCVGSDQSIDDALRFTRGGGRVVLVGLAAVPRGVDWTPIWFHEIEVKGSYTYNSEEYQRRSIRTFRLALDLVTDGKVDLSPLVTHKFKLENYKQALMSVSRKGRTGVIKAVFAFD